MVLVMLKGGSDTVDLEVGWYSLCLMFSSFFRVCVCVGGNKEWFSWF